MSKAKGRAPKLAPAPTLPPRDESIPDVRADDEVAIKPWCFLPDGVRMTPIMLHKIGWPNRFRVLDIKDHNGIRSLVLDPCCQWMEDHENGTFRCEMHPAAYFTKIETPAEQTASPEQPEDGNRVPHQDDRYTSLDLPWGEVVRVEYLEDERVPVIKVRFGRGRPPFSVSGEIARFLKERAVELGFL